MASDFSRTLSLLRQEREVSQRTAAGDLGISQALLSHYENGIREPGLAFVVRACDYYRVSADYILGRTLSKDGAMISSEDVYDADAASTAVLRGSVLATLQMKLLSGSLSILFDLLGKLGDRAAINAAAAYLGSAFYQLYRRLHRACGGNASYFGADNESFDLGIGAADMRLSELQYTQALRLAAAHKLEFPDLSAENLTGSYPGRCQSVAQVLHNADSRLDTLASK